MTAADVLCRLNEETLPDFCEPLTDVNQIGTFGNRPIHIVSFWGDTISVAALVEGGADINAIGDMGATPLHEAAGQGHAETVKFLLCHGAKPDVKDEFGRTPNDLAIENGKKDIADLLQRAMK
jgi:ankyrin repeat protein